MGVEGHLLLRGLDAIESIFKLVKDVKLLEESSHELSVFLLCGRRSISRCLGFVTHGDEDIPTMHDTSNVKNSPSNIKDTNQRPLTGRRAKKLQEQVN